jgi:hypothetical protein
VAFKKGTTLHEEKPAIDCARAPHCFRPALIRQETKEGVKNFCLQHYHEHLERERNAQWIAAGMPTREQSISKMRGFFVKTVSGGRFQERQPGEDDEALDIAGQA